MKLTPIDEILRNIFRKRHTEYEKIAGGKIEPEEIVQMLIAEGFAKEPAVRYGEYLDELTITMHALRAGTIPARRINTGAMASQFRASSLGIPPKATGGQW